MHDNETQQLEMHSVLVLMGGPDAEREVSIESGRAVAEALRLSRHLSIIELVVDAPDAETLQLMINECGADVVFPALHGPWGEGGTLQGMLDSMHVPYVGSDAHAASAAIDKWTTRERLRNNPSIRTPEAVLISEGMNLPLDLPVVLKPRCEGSSVGVYICRTTTEVEEARQVLHQKYGEVIAERCIDGREVTYSMLVGETLPLIEIVAANAFYDYDAKYCSDGTKYVVDPALPADVADQCIAAGEAAWQTIGCRDLVRVDFMVDEERPWLLEVNTMPGFTSHSLLPRAAAAVGIDFAELCSRLVDAAISRAAVPAGRAE